MIKPRRVKPPTGFNPRSVSRVTAGTLVTPNPPSAPQGPILAGDRNYNADARPPRRVPIGFVPGATTSQIVIAR
jgi:hypothetical protein